MARARANTAVATEDETAESERSFLDQASDQVAALILERGYDNTPMSLIARELGLTKAGVYHHFESKEDLLYAVHRRAMDRFLIPVLKRAEQEVDPEERLRVFLFEYAHLMTRDPSARILINESRRLSASRYEEIKGVWRRGYRLVRDALESLQRSGRCRADLDPGYSAFAALGMCSWILYWFDYARPDSGRAVAETMSTIFMAGILNQDPASPASGTARRRRTRQQQRGEIA